MAKKVIMPKLGLTMEEGVINKWLVREGDTVEKGDVLFEVETDKVNMEVESPASGVMLKIVHGAGDTVSITQAVAYIGKPGESFTEEAGEETASAQPETGEPVESAAGPAELISTGDRPSAQKTGPSSGSGRIKVSPLARKLAQQYGVDLTQVSGSGPGGRIVRNDVEKVRDEQSVQAKEPVASQPVPGKTAVSVPPAASRIPLSRIRRIIAARMLESIQHKPHFFIRQEIYAEELVHLRERILPIIEQRSGFRVSFTDIIIKMAARALVEFPMVNAYFTGEGIQMNSSVNIGVAVALEEGLIVPVIRDVDKKGLAEITAAVRDLSERARQGKLLPEEISGGTFTVSNLGMYGVDDFSAVINPPESAILACGAIKQKPYVDGQTIIPAHLMNLTLSADHRIVDGAVAAQFMQYLKMLLEEPLSLLL